MKKTAKYTFIITLVFLAAISAIYRFKHPEKTETQLFIDLIKGKVFYA
jgi:hypothetical protein